MNQLTAIVVAAPTFRKQIDLGGCADEGVYIQQEPFAQNGIFQNIFEVLSTWAIISQGNFYIFMSNTNTLPKTAFRDFKK